MFIAGEYDIDWPKSIIHDEYFSPALTEQFDVSLIMYEKIFRK